MNKTDIHVHAAVRRIPFSGGIPMDPESHYICDPEEMMETLKEQQITKAILMSSGEGPVEGVHSLGAYNSDCRQIAEESGGWFSWMCGIDPDDPDTVEDRMRMYRDQGAVGVGEVMVNQWLDSPYMSGVFAAAEKLHMPVLCHMSPEEGYSYGAADRAGLPLLEKTLRKYPELIFIGHSQVFWMEISGDCPKEGNRERSGFGRGPVQAGGTIERLFDSYPNLYADLSAYSGSCAIMRDERYGLYFLNKYQDRLMFGTDTFNRRTRFPLAEYMETKMKDGVLSREACEKIFTGNAEKLFFNHKHEE